MKTLFIMILLIYFIYLFATVDGTTKGNLIRATTDIPVKISQVINNISEVK